MLVVIEEVIVIINDLYFVTKFLSIGEREERRRGGKRGDYGIIVTNLPRRCSWQDLKDFMRKVGDVVFVDVDRYGEGVVEFSNRDDMDHALKTLDDTEFKSRDDSSYIRVKPAKKRDRSRSRSRSDDKNDRKSRRDRDRSYSSERSRSRERKRSPSKSPSRSRSPSPKNSKKEKDREEERREDDRGEDER